MPLAAVAQQRAIRLIGFTHTSSVSEPLRRAFEQGLRDTGYAEGQNLAILYRLAEGNVGRLPDLTRELIERGVEVIVTSGGSLSAQAAKAVTSTVPIVFQMGDADPVQAGLVASLGRPGGNMTGITILAGALGPKRVEILREIAPQAKIIAVLFNQKNRNSEPHGREVEAAIRAAGQRAVMLPAAGADEFDQAFARLVENKADALIVTADNVFTRQASQLTALAARHRIPAIYQWREFVEVGGLISYGASLNRDQSSGRCLYRPGSQGSQARRPADPAAEQVRTGDQSQDGEGARPRRAADADCPRRRGDRMKRREWRAQSSSAQQANPLGVFCIELVAPHSLVRA